MKRAAAKKSDGRNIAGTIYHRSHHPSLPAGNLYLHPWLIWRHPVPELDNHGHDYDGGRCRESRETFRITNRSEINGVHGPRTAQSRLTLRFLFAYTLFKTYIQPCYGWPRASPRWQSVFRCYRFHRSSSFVSTDRKWYLGEKFVFLLLLFLLEKVDSLDASLFRVWYCFFS